ncbi:TapY2 family type IVa secretion system protein [Ferrimonas futtsuensis]|uniref:TapY2 family type IVa secretion system protein n=1 Tax=Ferrimonas futtsuensis TaxID=364764 RepID=UPI00041580C5|nr:TapY2 family type IVa secretion system protein [Ferrimonas futtsuensis]
MKLWWMVLPLMLNQPVRLEYKCWLEDSEGHQRILFFLWHPNRARQEQQQLPGRVLADEPAEIMRVMECQPGRERFRSPQARALEQLTPR